MLQTQYQCQMSCVIYHKSSILILRNGWLFFISRLHTFHKIIMTSTEIHQVKQIPKGQTILRQEHR